jgi:uncharacterized protein (DUF1919 family)
MGYLNRILAVPLNFKRRKQLKNKSFSLVANNCVGTFICHDLGLQYKSPFVNLWMTPGDYIKLLSDFEGYMNTDLIFTDQKDVDYPVGILKDVKIYFQHYATDAEAYEKWNQRLKRLNYENLFVLFVEIAGSTYEDLLSFDRLPFQNKIALTHKVYPEIQSSVCIRGYEELGYVGKCYHYKNKHTGLRKYDDFDYVRWFDFRADS